MSSITITPRPQRTTAGKTSKYADFSVVSFPQLKKHAIIKSSLINIDPLSPAGAQSGNIKAFGERKKLMVIKTGTHQEMEEVSSRFSKEAGSEEIFIPENECEYARVSDARRKTMDEDTDDDYGYSPPRHRTKTSTQSMTTSNKKQTTTDHLPVLLTSGFDKDEDDDFNRILPNSSTSTTKKTSKRTREEVDSSSLSSSSDNEHDDDLGNRWSKNKENLIKTNLDLSDLKKKKTYKKKQQTNPTVVQDSCQECKNLINEVNLLKKRIAKLEKVYNVIKKNSSFDQQKSASPSNMDQNTFEAVQKIFGVDPSKLKAPINRPTKIMRELYKNSGFDLSEWKDIIGPNELVLRDFIQQKCLILDEDISHTWSTVLNSMAQMPYDAVKYKSKSNNNSLLETRQTNAPATIALSALDTIDNLTEQQNIMII